jgi:uncharacterized membrane protein
MQLVIWRVLFLVLCVAVVAGIVHVAIILLIPAFGANDAFALVSRSVKPFEFRTVSTSESLLNETDPFFSYGVCRFNFVDSGMYMSGPKIDSFWSATVLDKDGSVIYSLNSRTAIDNKLDLIVLDPTDILRLRDLQPPEAESAIIVETDVDEGFVVLRVLRPDESWIEKSDTFLKSVSCQPYRLAPADAGAAGKN